MFSKTPNSGFCWKTLIYHLLTSVISRLRQEKLASNLLITLRNRSYVNTLKSRCQDLFPAFVVIFNRVKTFEIQELSCLRPSSLAPEDFTIPSVCLSRKLQAKDTMISLKGIARSKLKWSQVQMRNQNGKNSPYEFRSSQKTISVRGSWNFTRNFSEGKKNYFLAATQLNGYGWEPQCSTRLCCPSFAADWTRASFFAFNNWFLGRVFGSPSSEIWGKTSDPRSRRSPDQCFQ